MKLNKLLAVCLSAVTIFGASFAAGCGSRENDSKGPSDSSGAYGDVVFDSKKGEMYLDTKEGKTPIKITYSEGNGSEWIRQLSRHFLEADEGKEYYIVLTIDAQATTAMSSKLEAGSNLDDIYYLLASPWQSYASLDQLENLDELYNTKIPGEEKTILEKITGSWKTYGQAYNQNNLHYYIFPSATSVTGLVYNKTMFDEYEWEVPETVTELKALCDRIVADTNGKIAPFVYPGKVSGGYWDFIGTNWWLQVSGEEKMNELMQFDSPELFNSDKLSSPSYGKLTMLQTFEDLIVKNKEKYIARMSGSYDHYQAQQAFGAGMAAMIPNGSWIQNESGEDIEDEIRMMPVPYMDNALKDEKGEYISYNYSGQPSFVAVPNKAKNKEGAKAFLAYVCRDDMLRLYTEICGTPMPFEYDVESISLNSFQQSCIDIWKNSTTWFEDSRSPLWAGLKVRKFNAGDPYVNLLINYPGVTADSWCAAEYAGVKGAWDTWVN